MPDLLNWPWLSTGVIAVLLLCLLRTAKRADNAESVARMLKKQLEREGYTISTEVSNDFVAMKIIAPDKERIEP